LLVDGIVQPPLSKATMALIIPGNQSAIRRAGNRCAGRAIGATHRLGRRAAARPLMNSLLSTDGRFRRLTPITAPTSAPDRLAFCAASNATRRVAAAWCSDGQRRFRLGFRDRLRLWAQRLPRPPVLLQVARPHASGNPPSPRCCRLSPRTRAGPSSQPVPIWWRH
jgi:hypothetical protein